MNDTNWRKKLVKQDRLIYQRQLRDKACTICRYAWKGGKICQECGDEKVNWIEAEFPKVYASC